MQRPGGVYSGYTGNYIILQKCDLNIMDLYDLPSLVNGVWTDWSVWSDCDCASASESTGLSTRTRDCTGISNDGKYCRGAKVDYEDCNGDCA